MSTYLPFQGLRVQPAFNQTIDTFTEFLAVPSSSIYKAVNDVGETKNQLAAIVGADNWFLQLSGTSFCGLYLPEHGITGHESLVLNYFNRATRQKSVIAFRPLQWSEPPKKRRHNLTPEQTRFGLSLTFVQQGLTKKAGTRLKDS